MAAAHGLGDAILARLGIDAGRQVLDIDPDAELPQPSGLRPRSDGMLQDSTHPLIVFHGPGDTNPATAFDAAYQEEVSRRLEILEQKPDWRFLVLLSGIIGVNAHDLLLEEDVAQVNRLDEEVRQTLGAQRKRILQNIGDKRTTLQQLEENKRDLLELTRSLHALYLNMRPVVRRWSWLLTPTGFSMYEPSVPLPYQLMVRLRTEYDYLLFRDSGYVRDLLELLASDWNKGNGYWDATGVPVVNTLLIQGIAFCQARQATAPSARLRFLLAVWMAMRDVAFAEEMRLAPDRRLFTAADGVRPVPNKTLPAWIRAIEAEMDEKIRTRPDTPQNWQPFLRPVADYATSYDARAKTDGGGDVLDLADEFAQRRVSDDDGALDMALQMGPTLPSPASLRLFFSALKLFKDDEGYAFYYEMAYYKNMHATGPPTMTLGDIQFEFVIDMPSDLIGTKRGEYMASAAAVRENEDETPQFYAQCIQGVIEGTNELEQIAEGPFARLVTDEDVNNPRPYQIRVKSPSKVNIWVGINIGPATPGDTAATGKIHDLLDEIYTLLKTYNKETLNTANEQRLQLALQRTLAHFAMLWLLNRPNHQWWSDLVLIPADRLPFLVSDKALQDVMQTTSNLYKPYYYARAYYGALSELCSDRNPHALLLAMDEILLSSMKRLPDMLEAPASGAVPGKKTLFAVTKETAVEFPSYFNVTWPILLLKEARYRVIGAPTMSVQPYDTELLMSTQTDNAVRGMDKWIESLFREIQEGPMPTSIDTIEWGSEGMRSLGGYATLAAGRMPPSAATLSPVLLTLLWHATVLVDFYYPDQRKILDTALTSAEGGRREAEKEVVAMASSDLALVTKPVLELLQLLYIPTRAWELQAMMTGRLRLQAFVVAGIARAHADLQKFIPQWAGVPCDLITGNAMVPGVTAGSTVPPELATDFAVLVGAYINKARLSFPVQYNKDKQYALAPVEFMGAAAALHDYNVDYRGGTRWIVTRRPRVVPKRDRSFSSPSSSSTSKRPRPWTHF